MLINELDSSQSSSSSCGHSSPLFWLQLRGVLMTELCESVNTDDYVEDKRWTSRRLLIGLPQAAGLLSASMAIALVIPMPGV